MRKLRNFLPVKVSPLNVVYKYTFPWSSYSFSMRQNLVLYDNLCNRAEYLIFGIFLPALPRSDIDISFPLLSVLIILLFMYILTLLVSNKPVSEHKFENGCFVNTKNVWKFSAKHFWDVFEVIFLVYWSIILVKSHLPKDFHYICKLFKNNFFQNTSDFRKLHYFYSWNFRTRHFSYLQSVLPF